MNPDGSNKTLLPANVYGEPSITTHGGFHWFLQTREVAGEFYPDNDPRMELFAVREDGNEAFTVQLTNQAELEIRYEDIHWAPIGETLDATVSWTGVEWDLQSGQALGAGIYEAMIEFDPAGNVVGLLYEPDPASPLIEVDVVGDAPTNFDPIPNVGDFSWSPDGTAIVWTEPLNDPQLDDPLIVTDVSQTPAVSTVIGFFDVTPGEPQWSPDGSRIALATSEGIETVAPNGSSRKVVVRSSGTRNRGVPRWSPTGSHLVYRLFTADWRKGFFQMDIYRVTKDGQESVDLTGGLFDGSTPVGWR
jgi:dipeptidyl aminopeptidase/acylaminoacyl peptidase